MPKKLPIEEQIRIRLDGAKFLEYEAKRETDPQKIAKQITAAENLRVEAEVYRRRLEIQQAVKAMGREIAPKPKVPQSRKSVRDDPQWTTQAQAARDYSLKPELLSKWAKKGRIKRERIKENHRWRVYVLKADVRREQKRMEPISEVKRTISLVARQTQQNPNELARKLKTYYEDQE